MNFGCLTGIFLSSAPLICRSTDISKYFRGSLRLRDNESRLYFVLCSLFAGECGFIEFANYSITGHNSQYLYDKSLEACKETCLTATNFFCVSFEYQQSGRLCQFNTGNRWTLLNFFAFYDGWTYYHRTCNTGTSQIICNIYGPTADVIHRVSYTSGHFI